MSDISDVITLVHNFKPDHIQYDCLSYWLRRSSSESDGATGQRISNQNSILYLANEIGHSFRSKFDNSELRYLIIA